MPLGKTSFGAGKVNDLASAPRPRKETPRQKAARERANTVEKLLNEAAVAPTDEYRSWKFGDEKPANVRNALIRVSKATPRSLYAAIRGNELIVSKSKLPGRSVSLAGER